MVCNSNILSSRLRTGILDLCNYNLVHTNELNPSNKEPNYLNFYIVPYEGILKLFTYL
jgi:hypothetical protein